MGKGKQEIDPMPNTAPTDWEFASLLNLTNKLENLSSAIIGFAKDQMQWAATQPDKTILDGLMSCVRDYATATKDLAEYVRGFCMDRIIDPTLTVEDPDGIRRYLDTVFNDFDECISEAADLLKLRVDDTEACNTDCLAYARGMCRFINKGECPRYRQFYPDRAK